jgi:NADH:ubiquinone oxidoreductase subunit E/NAD-dependent dihydropyrimidine dehydrogenase PreA subunit
MKKVGVFVCHCGRNIAATVSIPRVIDEVAKHPGVEHCEDYRYMCSEPGQRLIRERIKEKGLDGVVVACCSPSLHEETFRRIADAVGLNRYLLEIANIREQCSWVHSDVDRATSKAATIIKMIVEKAQLNEVLEPAKIPVTPKVMVLGAGIAGIQASLDIANSGYEVLLVEKSPSIGGHMAQLSETFPTLDCSQCILTPKMVEVAQHPNIQLHTYSELDDISGFAGNFKVKIRKKPRSVDLEKCTGCGDCWNLCPVVNTPQLRAISSTRETLEPEMLKTLDGILDSAGCARENIIAILQDINDHYNWLPREAIHYVAERLDLPFSYVYRIASFFTQFSLTPRGRHIIKVCLGTACFVRGAPRILDQIKTDLGIGPGDTTEDGLFTLETVNCLGACALGPLVVVDHDYHGRLKAGDIASVLADYNGKGDGEAE